MSFDPLTALFEAGKLAIERVWPDPLKRAEELRKLEEIKQRGNLAELDAYVKITLAQIEVNKAQAQHKSVFVAGARPAIIWVGGFSMAWAGFFHPLLTWVWAFTGMDGTPPPMTDPAWVGGIVTGLLGVSGMRSYDKRNGTQTDRIS